MQQTPFNIPIPWDNRFLTLAHVERVWHKLYGVVPSFVYDATTIYAVYMVIAAMLVVWLICMYKTLELTVLAILSGTTRVKGLTTVILWDIIMAYPIWFIWRA